MRGLQIMARKKKTRYSKERARIVRYLSKLKKQGRRIDLYIPTETELRKQGVKGTELFKLTRKLKSITPEELRNISYEIPEPTQESTNTPGFEPPENISEDATFFDAVVISGFKSHVRQFNERASNLLLTWLDRIIASNGEHDTAVMLNDGAEAGVILTYQVVYSQDKLTQYMSEMLDYLPEAGTLFKEELMDAMEQEEDFIAFK